MRLASRLASWFRNLLRRARVERELDDELRSYRDLLIAEKVRLGMAAEQALRAAALELGGLEQVKDEVRDVRTGAWLQGLGRDLRYAGRALRKRPAFTAIAALTLALGIGGTASIASLVHALFQGSLPFPDADRLVHVYQTQLGSDEYTQLSYVDYRYYREHARSFVSLAAHYSAPLHFVNGNESAAIFGSVASPNYFETLGLRPLRGRFFSRDEDLVPGRDPVVVLGYQFWRSRFGGDPSVLGRVIRLNGVPFTVVGIAPPGLVGVAFGKVQVSLWIPASMFGVGYKYCDGLAPGCNVVNLIGRLAPGVAVPNAQAELVALARQLEAASPETHKGLGVVVMPARGADPNRQAENTRIITLLGGAVSLVLLIVCANLAGLLLARNLARARETALRLSLGASRSRVVRELLTESLLLALLGGTLGIGVAALGNRLILSFYQFSYSGMPVFFELGLNPAVLAVTVGITLATVLAFGLLPALRASRTDLLTTMKDEGQGQSPSARRSRLRDALVVLQFALSLVLVVDASLLIRSLRHITQGEQFNPARVLTVRMRPTFVGYDSARARAFQVEVHARLEATPGIVAASPAARPAIWVSVTARVWLPNEVPADPQRAKRIAINRVGPRFFEILGVRPIAGREFDGRDRAGAPAVAIVNQTMAERFWPGRKAIGQRVVIDSIASEVVGVVPDMQYRFAGESAEPFVYQSYWQAKAGDPLSTESVTHILVAGDPRGMLPEIRRVIASVDPDVPVSEDRALVDRLMLEYQPVRFAGTLLGWFGALAIALSAFGLFGVLAFRVAERTREIGVRMALGAGPGEVARLVLRRGIMLALAGLAVGVVAALASVRLLRGLLYGVGLGDPLAFAAAAGLLVVVAAAASYLPARRATRLDPLLALRHD
jgi:putative ABC transport system permease protein